MQSYLQHLSRLRPALFFFLLILLGACKDTPETKPQRTKMFADFFVRYLAQEEQIRGQVSFWDGLSWSDMDPIEPDGVVSFEGRKMVSKRLSGNQVRFSETYQGAYEEPLAFRFRDKYGKYLQYELKMNPVRDFFVQGKISKQAGASFVINGGVMSKEESLVFLFTNAKNEATAITVEGPNPDVAIRLSASQIQGLSLGPGQLYLVKKQQKAESHPNLELTAAVEYYTVNREIVVEE